MKSAQGKSTKNQNAGSPKSGEPVFLAVGRFGKPHGIHGEISMQVYTDFPERLTPGTLVYIGPERRPQRLQSVRWHGNRLLIKFADYADREAVGELRNQWVLVPAEDSPPLPEGEYYHHELIGLEVRSAAGEVYGQITEILQTGANDVIIIRPVGGKELLIPWTDEVIQDVDLSAGVVTIQMLPGLI